MWPLPHPLFIIILAKRIAQARLQLAPNLAIWLVGCLVDLELLYDPKLAATDWRPQLRWFIVRLHCSSRFVAFFPADRGSIFKFASPRRSGAVRSFDMRVFLHVFYGERSSSASGSVRKVYNNDYSAAAADWWENMRFCVHLWNGETNGLWFKKLIRFELRCRYLKYMQDILCPQIVSLDIGHFLHDSFVALLLICS